MDSVFKEIIYWRVFNVPSKSKRGRHWVCVCVLFRRSCQLVLNQETFKHRLFNIIQLTMFITISCSLGHIFLKQQNTLLCVLQMCWQRREIELAAAAPGTLNHIRSAAEERATCRPGGGGAGAHSGTGRPPKHRPPLSATPDSAAGESLCSAQHLSYFSVVVKTFGHSGQQLQLTTLWPDRISEQETFRREQSFNRFHICGDERWLENRRLGFLSNAVKNA